jgi:outer membrane beta-barrel protein
MRTLGKFPALLATGLVAGLAWAPATAFAQGDEDAAEDGGGEDDDLSDILGPADGEESAAEERAQLEAGQTGDKVGARDEELILIEEEGRKKKVIKTIQRKNFLKLGRFELSPHAAFVANDPFLNRYIVGTGLGYHWTEIFATELSLDFAPDFGTGDWKPLTTQLVEENSVSPDISKLTLAGSLTFQYSPIYGKVAVVGRNIILFDIYGAFGMGMTRTKDDLEALQAVGDERAQSTEFQTHPTTNFGGGLRIIFGENIAARVEGRSLVYIETVNATTLEMKNNLILQASFSWFFPNLPG